MHRLILGKYSTTFRRFVAGLLSLIVIVAAIVTILEFPALQQLLTNIFQAPKTPEPIIAESSYFTVSPGCDKAKDPTDVKWFIANIQPVCLPHDGGTLIHQADPGVVGILALKAVSGFTLSKNQSVTVTLANLHRPDCAGIEAQAVRSDQRGYGFYVCGDGNWYIIKYLPSQGVPLPLVQSTPSTRQPASTTYSLAIIVEDDALQMTINGNETISQTDHDYGSSEQIGVLVAGENNIDTILPSVAAASVDVQDFRYLAL